MGKLIFLNFFYWVRLDGPLPVKNDNMAAMTLAVGVAYREIYSWKTAILYRRFVCQGTPSFVALEKTGESARARGLHLLEGLF